MFSMPLCIMACQFLNFSMAICLSTHMYTILIWILSHTIFTLALTLSLLPEGGKVSLYLELSVFLQEQKEGTKSSPFCEQFLWVLIACHWKICVFRLSSDLPIRQTSTPWEKKSLEKFRPRLCKLQFWSIACNLWQTISKNVASPESWLCMDHLIWI